MTDPRILATDIATPGRPRGWWTQQGRALTLALDRLWQAPVGSALTIAVIGIVLALPATLALALQNAETLSDRYKSALDVSVFLTPGLPEDAVTGLRRQLDARADLLLVRRITPTEGLTEFRAWSGLGTALDALPDNPLPTVLIVRLRNTTGTAATNLPRIAEELRTWKGVDQVVVDTRFASRLAALLTAVGRMLQVLWGLFGLTALLVIGNTIRLDVDRRHDEIEVIALLGGTDRYIRRPYLYSGVAYGALGGLLAFSLLKVSALLLAGPISALAQSYGEFFHVSGPGFYECLRLTAAGTLLGWIGAWAASTYQLRRLDPI
jgi:cell division transport system permease protein